jgi:HEAT repeat protein
MILAVYGREMNSAMRHCLLLVAIALTSAGCVNDGGQNKLDPLPKTLDSKDGDAESRVSQLLRKAASDDEVAASRAFRKIVMGGSASVDGLGKQLVDQESTSERLRIEAARALGMIGDRRAIPALMKAMFDDSENVRGSSVWALGMIGDPDAVSSLAKALGLMGKDPDGVRFNVSRFEVLESLGAIGDASAVSVLQKYLIGPKGTVDGDVAFALGRPRIPQAIHILEMALVDSNIKGRADLLGGIARFGGKPAIRVLAKAIADTDDYIRYRAAICLGLTRSSGPTRPLLGPQTDPAAAPPLIGAMQDTDKSVREEAANSLGVVGHWMGAPSLCAALEDTDASVRKAVAKALGKIGGTRACTALIEALGREELDFVRIAIVTALAYIEFPSATKAIVALADDKNSDVRRQVALALSSIGGSEAVSGLQTMLDDKNDDVRSAVLMGLVKIGGSSALRVLQKRKVQLGKKVDDKLLGAVWITEKPHTIQQLKEASKHKNKEIRVFAMTLLIHVGTLEAMSVLREISEEDNSLWIRSTAKRCVEELIAEDPWW